MFENYGFYCLLLICSLHQAMGVQYREVWRPYSNDNALGVTFEKLQVFQVYFLERETSDQTWLMFKRCSHLSDSNREKKHVQIRNKEKLVKPCHSVLQNCRFDPEMYDRTAEMYEYMELTNPYTNPRKVTHFYGHHRNCKGFEEYSGNAPFYATCTCDCESSEQKEDRYFSLLDVLSDEYKVLTGFRIRKINHVFHIQIQQGALGSSDVTIVGEGEWKDVHNISTSDLLSTNVSKYLKTDGDDLLQFHKNDLVYAVTSKQKTILLDDLKAGSDEVVTGLRFRQIDNDLRLEIHVTPFNQRTGTLYRNASHWVYNKIDKSQRKPVTWSDGPRWNGEPADIFSNDKYIRFETSDFKSDLGQETHPYINIQEIVDEQPSPLMGAGIFFEGYKSSHGFITFKGFYDVPGSRPILPTTA